MLACYPHLPLEVDDATFLGRAQCPHDRLEELLALFVVEKLPERNANCRPRETRGAGRGGTRLCGHWWALGRLLVGLPALIDVPDPSTSRRHVDENTPKVHTTRLVCLQVHNYEEPPWHISSRSMLENGKPLTLLLVQRLVNQSMDEIGHFDRICASFCSAVCSLCWLFGLVCMRSGIRFVSAQKQS